LLSTKDSSAGGIFHAAGERSSSPHPGRSTASAVEMNTSLDEIETLASNYDDGRMQLWQPARPPNRSSASADARRLAA